VMRIPAAIYRIQFNPSFGFDKAKSCVRYLADLGISDIYASPIFRARKGSLHGYDVVDQTEINPELGGREGFEELSIELKKSGIGWIQDIVPNHMAYDYGNRMLMDVLARGKDSDFYRFFDIDWNHRFDGARGQLLAPFLGRFYEKCLEDGEIQLSLHHGEIRVNYYGLKFPLFVSSYARILSHRPAELKMILDKNNAAKKRFPALLSVFETETGRKRRKKKRNGSPSYKLLLEEICAESREVKELILENIKIFNGDKGNPESFALLDGLLSGQIFRLSFWKVATEEINYRRFFNVNELICLRTEDRDVFDHTHSLIFTLLEEKKFSGLRIDHVDGLYDPTGYLKRLRERAGEAFLIVEKILDPDEELIPLWPVQGTTGYDWLNLVNSLFCDTENEKKFDRIYIRFSGFDVPYGKLVADKKRMIIGQHMAGDIDNLASLLKQISAHSRQGRDITMYGLRRAIVEIMAQFPVYRTYITGTLLRDRDLDHIRKASERAREKIPGLLYEIDLVEHFLSGRSDFCAPEERCRQRNFIMRFQQFTGPLMAKGFEDTVLYVYNRLLSLNEVGGSPDRFGIPLGDFHRFSHRRTDLFPHSINATATHDAKRGEDVRARLNVLSEIPDEWNRKIRLWSRMNKGKKRRLNGTRVPDRNDEYFLYQTLVGAFPFQEEEYPSFVERMKRYIVKSVREAKIYTAWLKPDLDYEEAYVTFMQEIFDPSESNPFLREFLSFQKKIAHYGIFNSLSQTLLKYTSPGIPDLYQGTELWDLSLVDPDNRRPVDFAMRKKILEEIASREKENGLEMVRNLLDSREDGKIKLFLIYKALKARKENPRIFERGSYIPLHAEGKRKRHIIAFARKLGGSWLVSIVPRFFTAIMDADSLPLGAGVWQDTSLLLPEKTSFFWKDMFLNRNIKGRRSLPISEILEHFPVGLLMNEKRA
jgi:(1->4)-alpha-D-glucan 1-alpha-D-glucosylmutase